MSLGREAGRLRTGMMMLQTSFRMRAEESRSSKNRNAAAVTSAMLTCMLHGKLLLAMAIPAHSWASSTPEPSPWPCCCPFCRSCSAQPTSHQVPRQDTLHPRKAAPGDGRVGPQLGVLQPGALALALLLPVLPQLQRTAHLSSGAKAGHTPP